MPGDLGVLGLLNRLAAAACDAGDGLVGEVRPGEVAGHRDSRERHGARARGAVRGRSPGERVVQSGSQLLDRGELR